VTCKRCRVETTTKNVEAGSWRCPELAIRLSEAEIRFEDPSCGTVLLSGVEGQVPRGARTGTTVIMATHDAGIVDQMRKRVIELHGGVVVRDQTRGVYGYQS
jgi:ATPase subunit of ABC transporter with duplicated ATPase domains